MVDEFLERLIFANIAQIIEELIPETRIDQVSRGVLGTAEIEVHLTPVSVHVLINQRFVVVRVHITQVVRRRACEARHGAELQREDGLVVNQRFVYYLAVRFVPCP